MEKSVLLTKHAAERALKYNLTKEAIIEIIRRGRRLREGKTKVRFTLKTKRGLLVAICEEYTNQIIVLTITKGKKLGVEK